MERAGPAGTAGGAPQRAMQRPGGQPYGPAADVRRQHSRILVHINRVSFVPLKLGSMYVTALTLLAVPCRFCFETSLKALYWSILVYRYQEVGPCICACTTINNIAKCRTLCWCECLAM